MCAFALTLAAVLALVGLNASAQDPTSAPGIISPGRTTVLLDMRTTKPVIALPRGGVLEFVPQPGGNVMVSVSNSESANQEPALLTLMDREGDAGATPDWFQLETSAVLWGQTETGPASGGGSQAAQFSPPLLLPDGTVAPSPISSLAFVSGVLSNSVWGITNPLVTNIVVTNLVMTNININILTNFQVVITNITITNTIADWTNLWQTNLANVGWTNLLPAGWTNSWTNLSSVSNLVDYMLLSPSFLRQPRDTTVVAGGKAILEAQAVGAGPITYEWFKNGVLVPGAAEPRLELSSVQAANEGDYEVVARNANGTARSAIARIAVAAEPWLGVDLCVRLTLVGEIGRSYRLEYADSVGEPVQWQALTTMTLTNSPQVYVDLGSSGAGNRIYRAVVLP